MENANMNFPRSCKCSSFVSSRYPWFFRYITNMAINEQPATNVLAHVYQLYIVEYQCASILISQSHGMVDITVRAKTNNYIADHTVFVQVKLFPSSTVIGLLSMSRVRRRILIPISDHNPTVNKVHTTKNPLLRKGDFVCSA